MTTPNGAFVITAGSRARSSMLRGGGTINLTAGCTYALTSADNGENGLPVVTTQIGVNGNGATIDGTGAVRVFEVDGPGGKLSAQNVAITGGSADVGGGIENVGGTVTLNNSQVTGNTAAHGGGIFNNDGTVTLAKSSVTGNTPDNCAPPGTVPGCPG